MQIAVRARTHLGQEAPLKVVLRLHILQAVLGRRRALRAQRLERLHCGAQVGRSHLPREDTEAGGQAAHTHVDGVRAPRSDN